MCIYQKSFIKILARTETFRLKEMYCAPCKEWLGNAHLIENRMIYMLIKLCFAHGYIAYHLSAMLLIKLISVMYYNANSIHFTISTIQSNF